MPSIEKRGKASWRLIVEDSKGPGGKRVPQKKTIKVEDPALLRAPTKLENHLKTELVKFQLEVESGEYVKPSRSTFKDFVEEWKKNYAEVHLGGYTRRNYYATIETYLNPEFGHKELHTIKTMHVVNFMTQLSKPSKRKNGKIKALATNTQLNIYRVLKSILDAAAKWRVISINPIEGIDRPVADKQEKREMKKRKKAYTTEEAMEVILTLQQEPVHWRLYFLGVIIGGFRRGELLAVEWSQVDFVNGGLHIEKQITFDEESNVVESDVKTEESEAFVPMPYWYMAALEDFKREWDEQKDLLGDKWRGDKKEYVFHAGKGESFYPDAPTLRWRRTLDKYKLPRIRLHDLRHTTAMLLREDDVDMKSIQERLRHARMETTSNLYTHHSTLVSRKAADHLEKFDPELLRSRNDK